MVELGIGEDDALDGHVPVARGRMAVELLHLITDIG